MKINRYWFKPKKYGYGVTPSTWEGWLFTAICAGMIIYFANIKQWLLFSMVVVLLIGGAYLRTDGDWKWRWGNK